MSNTVIATYRPKPRKSRQLLALVKTHVPRLRKLGLATPFKSIVLRAKDGTLLEIFEWKSAKAVEQAHSHPGVMEIWNQFFVLCDCIKLAQLAESKEMFPHFDFVGSY